MTTVVLRRLPARSYALKVQKLYAERVQAYFFAAAATSSCNSTPIRIILTRLDTTHEKGVSKKRRGYHVLLLECHSSYLDDDDDDNRAAPSRLLFHQLPPMARQNLSWVGAVTHHATIRGTAGEEDGVVACTATTDEKTTTTGTSTMSPATTTTMIGDLIWKESLEKVMLKQHWKHHSENTGVSLRVDCHPKEITEEICLQLQQQAAAAAAAANDTTIQTTIVTDPFEGPIPMTLSASKCTHRLAVIQCRNNGNDSTTHDGSSYYWGLMNRSSTKDGADNDDAIIMNLKLNHQAHAEIVRVPADNFTAADVVLAHKKTDPTAPLSRAYYKLHQVWQDGHLSKIRPQPSQQQQQPNTKNAELQSCDHDNHDHDHWLRGTVGLDLGAAPGGWTQVLVHCLGLKSVVAVDAGRLAQRVMGLPQVRHVPCTMEKVVVGSTRQPQEQQQQLQHLIPTDVDYSIFVCDASVQWDGLLDLLVRVVGTVSWTLPAVAVVTLKLPFKTTGSIERHVCRIGERLPQKLQELSEAMYGSGSSRSSDNNKNVAVATDYQVLHLMANADSERTLVVHFNRKGNA